MVDHLHAPNSIFVVRRIMLLLLHPLLLLSVTVLVLLQHQLFLRSLPHPWGTYSIIEDAMRRVTTAPQNIAESERCCIHTCVRASACPKVVSGWILRSVWGSRWTFWRPDWAVGGPCGGSFEHFGCPNRAIGWLWADFIDRASSDVVSGRNADDCGSHFGVGFYKMLHTSRLVFCCLVLFRSGDRN